MLIASTATLHLGNPFTSPFQRLKDWRKIILTYWETGHYVNGNPVSTDRHFPGWTEFTQKKLSRQDIEDVLRTQQDAISKIVLTEEKIYLELEQEIPKSESFPFEHTYGTLEIFLVDDPTDYVHPNIKLPDWNNCFDKDLDVFDKFDDWCFPHSETLVQRLERCHQEQLAQADREPIRTETFAAFISSDASTVSACSACFSDIDQDELWTDSNE